jgi:AraC family transcriptional regulator
MPAPAPVITRRTLCRTDAVLAEAVRYRGLGRDGTPETFEPARQVVVTARGAFHWHVGRSTSFVDGNHVAFVRDGDVSRDTSPVVTDIECIILTPSAALARALWRSPASASASASASSDPFRRRTALASNELLLAFATFASALSGAAAIEPAVAEESTIALLDLASACAGPRTTGEPAAPSRLCERARELLSTSGTLLSLPELAAALSVSPAYLTDRFRRAFGMPIVRYQLKLRLARALAELPHRDDLAALALELGFSSHSHFSTAFRAAMGITPSHARRGGRPGQLMIERS